MWKSLSKLSLVAFLGLLFWTSTTYNDNQIPLITWQQIKAHDGIPNNQQVRLPEGTAVHPLALISETKDGKLSVYQYIYVPDENVSAWNEALTAFEAGNQQPIVDLGKKTEQVVVVDTFRYNGKAKADTPKELVRETDTVGYYNQGFEYLKANKSEFQSLYGHIPKEKFIVLIENPALRPSEAFPATQALLTLLALIAALVFAGLYRKSK